MKQRDLIAQIQLLGVDMNPSSLSKLEGQYRIATDYELRAIATVLGTTIDELVESKGLPHLS